MYKAFYKLEKQRQWKLEQQHDMMSVLREEFKESTHLDDDGELIDVTPMMQLVRDMNDRCRTTGNIPRFLWYWEPHHPRPLKNVWTLKSTSTFSPRRAGLIQTLIAIRAFFMYLDGKYTVT